MKTPTFNPEFMSFSEWEKENSDFIDGLEEKHTTEDCPDCRGQGFENCFNCGHDHPCDRCDGDGVIDVDDRGKAAFIDQLAKDRAVLRRYQEATGAQNV